MGTRYGDQPPEHWAGPESLDPTPVWKQFLVVGLLALGALAIIAIVSLFALAPQLATPPALVPGERLVLTRAQAGSPAGDPVRIVLTRDGPQLGTILFGPGGMEVREPLQWSPGQEFLWIFRIAGDDFVAVSGYWKHPDTGEACRVGATLGSLAARTDRAVPAFRADCASPPVFSFGARGEPLDAPRGLDRYLVSVDGDRVIVNLSREIRGFGKTPQPTRSPL